MLCWLWPFFTLSSSHALCLMFAHVLVGTEAAGILTVVSNDGCRRSSRTIRKHYNFEALCYTCLEGPPLCFITTFFLFSNDVLSTNKLGYGFCPFLSIEWLTASPTGRGAVAKPHGPSFVTFVSHFSSVTTLYNSVYIYFIIVKKKKAAYLSLIKLNSNCHIIVLLK